MFSIFSKKREQEIESLKGKIKELEDENIKLRNTAQEMREKLFYYEKEVEKKKEEIEIKMKNLRIREKQMDILEKNLKSLHKNNTILKEDGKTLKDSTLDANLPIEKHKYKLPTEKYFSGTKYKEVLSLLDEKNIEFLCEIDEATLEQIKQDIEPKKADEILRKYNEYLSGDLDIEMKIYALKGEKITKVYSKLRNFIAYTEGNSQEYMNDLLEFDFLDLINYGFRKAQIEGLSEKASDYFEKNIIKERTL